MSIVCWKIILLDFKIYFDDFHNLKIVLGLLRVHMWSQKKQETFGISALKSNGNVITDSLSKAEILNSHFKSVFTPQSGNTFPQLPGTQCPKINPLYITENGVFMLLDRINVSKSSGPDKLPGRLLQSLDKEITPVVVFIFTQLLCTGELPTEWTQANVAPIF